MKVQLSFFIVLSLLLSQMGRAQDCTLDIGGENDETLVRVFQLSEAQTATMEQLKAELKIELRVVEDEIKKLLDSHPQSTQEELTLLAEKYKVLQQKMVNASKAADKEFLSSFNEKQYDRYLALCNEAFRRPFQLTPVPLTKSDN